MSALKHALSRAADDDPQGSMIARAFHVAARRAHLVAGQDLPPRDFELHQPWGERMAELMATSRGLAICRTASAIARL